MLKLNRNQPIDLHVAHLDEASIELALKRCSYEKVFWEYAANLQGNTHAEVRFQ